MPDLPELERLFALPAADAGLRIGELPPRVRESLMTLRNPPSVVDA
jgi:hypothetical protein